MVGNGERSQPSGTTALIAGAGVGGLMAALELWRRGCNVRVLERTKASVTSGDSFTMGPSALRAFRHWPEMQTRNDEIAYHPLLATHDLTGERIKGPMEFPHMSSSKNAGKATRHSRPAFHKMLLEQLSKCGIEIEFDREVVDYYEDPSAGQAGVILRDGSKHTANLVVAADGLRGQSWSLVAGGPVPARSSGRAAYRVAYPVALATADPMVSERFKLQDDGRSILEMWTGEGMYALFWRNQDQMIWSVNHPDDGMAEESWNNNVDPEEALKFTATIPDWPEVADRIIKATPPELLVDFKLMWRDPQPKWTSPGGHVIQLGDAAHTFLPSSGNGGTQAIEDAVSLAACVAMVKKDNIPDATRVHNLLRFERVSCLQALGIANREARVAKNQKKEEKVTHKGLGSWLAEHDPEQYAFDNYDKALASLTGGEPFKNTNIPPNLSYKPWTIESLTEALAKGEPSIMDGDWSG